MEDPTRSQDIRDFFKSTINQVETIQDTINYLFGEDSSDDGLFSTRASLLHQFSILASAYHQLNTLDFLDNDEDMSSIFGNEISIANFRTRDYENKALDQIRKLLKPMEEYLDDIVAISEDIIEIQNEADYHIEYMENSYYENLVHSLLFYLIEIDSRILKPAGTILHAEITASTKLLNTIDKKLKNSIETSMEAIARMCEVMSWGLETPPGWNSIQTDTNELTGDLQKKIGSLKALSTFYKP